MSDPPSTGPPLRAGNLNYLRKQAKALLRKARDGDVDALSRFAAIGGSVSLSTAQFLIAKDAGFESWPKLRDEFHFREHLRAAHRLGASVPLQPGEKCLRNKR